MSDNGNKKPGSGCLTAIVVFVIIVILAMIGGGMDNDYEKAGKEFGTWTKKDPSTWTSTEKQYFNDFRTWADKN